MKRLLVFALLLSFCLAGVSTAWAKSIKIGLLGPMTGPLANEGEQMKKAVELAAAELNNRGGLLGQPVDIIVADDAGAPQTGIAASQKLIDEGVVAVIGSYPSSVTAAVQDHFGKARIVQITNASTARNLSERGIKTFFRICPRDDDQAQAALETIIENGYKRVALLYDGTTYSKELAKNTRALLQTKQIEIAFDGALPADRNDYREILTRIKESRPEAVFFTGYYPEAAVLLRQRREMHWDVPFIGGDAAHNPDLVNIAGKKAVTGFQFLSLPRPENLPSPLAKEFRAKFKERYGHRVSSIYALLAADAFGVLTHAIKETKSTDPDKLSDYLHFKLKDYPGITGTISFDQNGDREGQIFVDYILNSRGKAVLQL